MLQTMDMIYQHYWKRAQQDGISRLTNAFTCIPAEKRESGDQLARYFHRYFIMSEDPDSKSETLYALINAAGMIVETYGGREAKTTALRNGLRTGVVLSYELLGPNAVSIGLKEERNCNSIGEQNYSVLLQKYAIYFAAIHTSDTAKFDEPIFNGGIAAIVPVEYASPDYQTMAYGMAHGAMLYDHMLCRNRERYSVAKKAILTCVVTDQSNLPIVTFCDNRLFSILDLEERDLTMKPLNELFDAPPRNKEFWDLVWNRENVQEKELTVYCRHQPVHCIIDVSYHVQPYVGTEGYHFAIYTPSEVVSFMSDKIANSAVRGFDSIIGRSPAMLAAIRKAKLLANTDSNMMLLGESGAGKDVFAQAIHNNGKRSGKPFIAVNCGALPRDLIVSELFGYEAGSFTGAKRKGNIGKFELANGGTLFLDEIGTLPLDLQATLLRAVEQKKFTRLGGNVEIKSDVRIICATNENLPELIRQKLFREDLYFRLSTVWIDIPPLRKRGNDIISLAEYFISNVSARLGREPMILSEGAKRLLLRLQWPGNVRELQAVMESIVSIYPDKVIEPTHILENIRPDEVTAYLNAEPEDMQGMPMASTIGSPYASQYASSYASPYGAPVGTPYGSTAGTPYGSTAGTPYGSTAGTPYGSTTGTPATSSAGLPYGTPATSSAGLPYETPATSSAGLPYETPAATSVTPLTGTSAAIPAAIPAGTSAAIPAAPPVVSPETEPEPVHKIVRGAHGKRQDLDKETIRQCLEKNSTNRSDAAKELGISRNTLYRYIKEYGL